MKKYLLVTELDDVGDLWTHVAYFTEDELAKAQMRQNFLITCNHVISCKLYETKEVEINNKILDEKIDTV
jgi:hypothetical protein